MRESVFTYKYLTITLCHTANEFVGISFVVKTGLWFHIYGCSRLYGARDVKETAQ